MVRLHPKGRKPCCPPLPVRQLPAKPLPDVTPRWRLVPFFMSRLSRLAAVALACAAGSLSFAASWPAPALAERYVQEALAQNLGLQAQGEDIAAAQARLDLASGARQPRVDLLARYTRASGGRTIDVPAGDLLNPAYATLNELLVAQGRPAIFPTVDNLQIPLIREREQDTRVRLTAPLLNLELSRLRAARGAGLEAATAQHAALRREVRLAVLVAYYNCLRTRAAEAVLRAASDTTTEALRVTRLLAQEDKATEDRVLRAEADDLGVQQQLADAARDRAGALHAFNLILHRPLDTPVDEPPAEEIAALTDTLTSAALPETNVPEAREELTALKAAVAEADATEKAKRARQLPTVSFLFDGGIQGASYRFDGGAGYSQASLIGEYNLWDGKQRSSEIEIARRARRQAELRYESARQLLTLEVKSATEELIAARTALPAAQRRAEASSRAFELVSARDREGLTNQLAFLDARTSQTTAQLNLTLTRQRLLIAGARLDRALAATPIP